MKITVTFNKSEIKEIIEVVSPLVSNKDEINNIKDVKYTSKYLNADYSYDFGDINLSLDIKDKLISYISRKTIIMINMIKPIFLFLQEYLEELKKKINEDGKRFINGKEVGVEESDEPEQDVSVQTTTNVTLNDDDEF